MQFEIRLRERNQITLPEAAVHSADLKPGDRLVMDVVSDDPAEFLIRPIRKSYAGSLRGVYGDSPDEIAAYLNEEKASWGEPT